MPAQAPRVVLRVASVGREEGEVPVLGYVPVEGVDGVYEDEQKPVPLEWRRIMFANIPEPEQRCPATVGRLGIPPT